MLSAGSGLLSRATAGNSKSCGRSEWRCDTGRNRRRPIHGLPVERLAAHALADRRGSDFAQAAQVEDVNLSFARAILAEIEQAMVEGTDGLRPLAQAVELEIAIATADAGTSPPPPEELARLKPRVSTLTDDDVAQFIAVRDPCLKVLRFDFDAGAFRNVASASDFPVTVAPRPSHLAVFCCDGNRTPMLVDQYTARICELSDGSKTVRQIVRQLVRDFRDEQRLDHHAWVEELVVLGFLKLQHAPRRAGGARSPLQPEPMAALYHPLCVAPF